MLQSNALYFPSVETLEDKFEGSFVRPSWFGSALSLTPEQSKRFEAADAKMRTEVRKTFRPATFVNCWHLSDHESAAMWKVYLTSNEGVAIVSTFERLAQSIKDPREIEIGKVQYRDYSKDAFPAGGNLLHIFLSKQKSFEYEKGIRALYWDSELMGEINVNPTKRIPGHTIAVDLSTLVEEICVAPTSPSWFHKLVEGTLKTYQLDKEVKQSSLDDDPVW
jgi:hypothetical protein